MILTTAATVISACVGHTDNGSRDAQYNCSKILPHNVKGITVQLTTINCFYNLQDQENLPPNLPVAKTGVLRYHLKSWE